MSKDARQTLLWSLVSPLVIALLTAYITTRPTKADEGRALLDVVLIVINVGALVALGYAVSLNVRDAHRAFRLKEVMEDMKKEHADALRYASAAKLRELDKRRADSEYPLLKAGKLSMLAEDADWLSFQLLNILRQNNQSSNPQILSRPLSSRLLNVENNVPISLQRAQLLSFRDQIRIHIRHVIDAGAGDLALCRLDTPNDMISDKQILDALAEHKAALRAMISQLLLPYAQLKRSLEFDIQAASSSAAPHT